MTSVPLLAHCDCCGLPVDAQSGEDCPRCQYPITIPKEERFLENAVRDLQRVAEHGGTDLTVSSLIRRYQKRLAHLRQLESKAASVQPAIAQEQRQPDTIAAPQPVSLLPEPSGVIPLNTPVSSSEGSAGLSRYDDAHLFYVPPPVTPSAGSATDAVVAPLRKVVPLNPFAPPQRSSANIIAVEHSVVDMQAQQSAPRRAFTFSWKSFVLEQAITLIGLVGAFLILMGALSSVVTLGSSRLLSFLIVFGVHAFFGMAGVVAYRFANFRLIARIYTGIYVLLVPLVSFTAYSLLEGNYIQLSVPMLIAIAAAYASIVYLMLAVYQRFSLFAYLGMVALVVTDLAIVRSFSLSYWWWPSMLMLLTLPSLQVLVRVPTSGREKFFTGPLNILRDPIRFSMYVLVGICVLAFACTALYSFSLDLSATPLREVRFSILSMSVLLLLWTGLALWITKHTQNMLVLALLFLACILSGCYAFEFSQGGYVLVLAGVALCYHGLHRFAGRLLQAFGQPGLQLDQIALVLVTLIPFISFPLLPLQLLLQANQVPEAVTSVLSYHVTWNTFAGLTAILLGSVMTISIALFHTNRQNVSTPQGTGWPWLLLLTGFLLNYAYGSVVLDLDIVPVWSFLSLTIALVIAAALIRQRFGAMWANPVDVVVLSEMLITLSLSLNQNLGGPDTTGNLLLTFAALTYAVLLYQRRATLLFLPFLFALLALFDLLAMHPYEILLLGLVLPFAAVVVHRFMSARMQLARSSTSSIATWLTTMWEWPLLAFGLLCGIAVSCYDFIFSISTVHNWPGLSFPLGLEMATFAGVWYAAAALARIKWWLVPAIGFAVGAVLLPSNPFWVLVSVTFIAATLALALSRFTSRIWASPLYIVALLGAVMAGSIGWSESALTTLVVSWLLLAFGLFAYIIGLVEDLEPCLWLLPAFAIWALIDAARLGDLYRPPTVALVSAAMGMALGLLNFVRLPLIGTSVKGLFLRYALPFYTSAFAAAVLTGVYGMLPGAAAPFYGAIPDALLIYALVAFGVVLFERQPKWLWLVAGFAVWATLLATQLNIFYVTGIGLSAGIVAVLLSKLIRQPAGQISLSALPFYMTALVAAVLSGYDATTFGISHLFYGFVPDALPLFVYAGIAFAIMLIERRPELLVVPVGFAVWGIWGWLPHQDIASLMIAYSALCVLIFGTQFVWNLVPSASESISADLLHHVLGVGGQLLIVVLIIVNGGLVANSGRLAFVGAGSLLVLALLLCGYGYIQQEGTIWRYCNYGAGLLVALSVSWVLEALHQTNVDLLTLAPATYLILVAPILMRNETLPGYRHIGQATAILGTVFLLLPTLWLSFSNSDGNLLYTLILMGEAVVLLLLGIGVGVRVFVLTGTGLVLIGAIHTLFLTASGIPAPLVLTAGGVLLLAVATLLHLLRHRFKAAWAQWD